MNRQEKEQEVARLKKQFGDIKHAFLINYQGVSVNQVQQLRHEVRQTGSGYEVVKNTLMKRAAAGLPIEGLTDHLSGPTAVAWNSDDPVALAKVLKTFVSAHPVMSFKAGLVDGQTIGAERIQEVASLPGMQELRGQFAVMLASPMRRLATALNGPSRGLASVLKQQAEKSA